MSLKFSAISISKFDEEFPAFFIVSVKGLGQNGCVDWMSISKGLDSVFWNVAFVQGPR